MREKEDYTYKDWFMMVLEYIPNTYACRASIPIDLENKSTKDGLTLKFYNINWDCFISNYQLHTIFDNAVHRRAALADFKDLIAGKLEDQIFISVKAKDKRYKKTFKTT